VAPGLGFAVIWGVSANTRAWVVQEDLSWLGWTPQDDAEAYAGEVEPEPPGLTEELDGGPYVGRLQDPKYD
jgi:uronate dehydrogenase